MWRFRNLNRGMKILALLCILACIEFVLELVMASLLHYNTFVTDYYEFVELCVVCSVFLISAVNRSVRLIVLLMGVGYVVYWLFNIPSPYSQEVISGNTSIVSRMVMVAMSVVMMYSVSLHRPGRMIGAPIFWMSLGVLLYNSGSVVVFAFADILLKIGLPYFSAAWNINWILNIAAYLFYSQAFLCKQQV